LPLQASESGAALNLAKDLGQLKGPVERDMRSSRRADEAESWPEMRAVRVGYVVLLSSGQSKTPFEMESGLSNSNTHGEKER
tara:strand:+ start:313 stop:558 length:246 start_codon:yes stop_codon:yes gene_type:complete